MGRAGTVVPPAALDAFVARVMEFGPGGALRGAGAEAMGRAGRRMAERATWDKIGSEVAMELARSLPEAEEGMAVAQRARSRDATFVGDDVEYRGHLAHLGWYCAGLHIF